MCEERNEGGGGDSAELLKKFRCYRFIGLPQLSHHKQGVNITNMFTSSFFANLLNTKNIQKQTVATEKILKHFCTKSCS